MVHRIPDNLPKMAIFGQNFAKIQSFSAKNRCFTATPPINLETAKCSGGRTGGVRVDVPSPTKEFCEEMWPFLGKNTTFFGLYPPLQKKFGLYPPLQKFLRPPLAKWSTLNGFFWVHGENDPVGQNVCPALRVNYSKLLILDGFTAPFFEGTWWFHFPNINQLFIKHPASEHIVNANLKRTTASCWNPQCACLRSALAIRL